MMTSLKDQFQSYGAYHRDLRNLSIPSPARGEGEITNGLP